LPAERAPAAPAAGPRPDFSLRTRAVIADGDRLLLDRTHSPHKAPFYWFPGGGVEAGETAAEALARELLEEASLEIEVGQLLYVSENLFVESGEYRHEVILYFRARIVGEREDEPVDPRDLGWYRPADLDGPLLPADVAREVARDVREEFRRPPRHLVTDARPA
jgi:ADP-ribose pyrophosphatase YjhB (NUDIX family)